MKKINLLILIIITGGFTNLYSQCEDEKGYYDFPFTENGITVTETLTGNIQAFSSGSYTDCGITEKINSIWIGYNGPATIRNDFSVAINDLLYNIAGSDSTEQFTFTVSNGTAGITIDQSDCSSGWSISGNVLTCIGHGGGGFLGAGGRFKIHSTQSFTWISISHNGAENGSVCTLCFDAAFQSVQPTLTTTAITSITSSTAASGGNISADGGSSVTARGVCWNTTGTPTISDPKTTDGTGIGSYPSSITGLSASTTYYVRAYATNANGTAYGNELSFTTSNTSSTSDPTSITVSNSAICNGGNTQLTANGAQGTVYWYTGSCGGTQVATGNPITVNPTSTTTYYAQNYNNSLFSNGCASTTITVNLLPVAGDITGAGAVCMGSTLQLSSNATGTATLTYVWNSSNTSVATVDNAGLVTPVAQGSTNITYTVTDGSSTACTATSATFGITVNPLPVAGDITGGNAVCMGNTLQLSSNATGTAPLSYVWHSSNTGVATVDNTGLVTPVASGSTNITYTVTDGSTTACTATSAIFGVTVNSLQISSISGPSSVCFNSIGNVYTTESGMSSYNWNVTGGTITAGTGTNSITVT